MSHDTALPTLHWVVTGDGSREYLSKCHKHGLGHNYNEATLALGDELMYRNFKHLLTASGYVTYRCLNDLVNCRIFTDFLDL